MLPNFDSYYLVTEFEHESPIIGVISTAQLMTDFKDILSERDRSILSEILYYRYISCLHVVSRRGRTITETLESIELSYGALVQLDEKVSDAEVGEALKLVNRWQAQRKPCPLLFRPSELLEGFKPMPEKIEFKSLPAINDKFNLFNTKGR